MKRNIIAIGGGRIMVPSIKRVQTLNIDEQIVKQTAKRSPTLLFIPTASEDNADYCAAIERLYGEHFGCKVKHLLLYRNRPVASMIAKLIKQADIIYVGGGNTLRMMKLWRKLGIDKELDRARKRGAVLCGLSAGAICWFQKGNSDSRKFSDESDKTLIQVKALNYVKLLLCPHYDTEPHRQPSLKRMMKSTPGVAVALENCTAIHIKDDQFRIITSRKNRHAWHVYWYKGQYFKEKIPAAIAYRPLGELLDLKQTG